MTDHDLEMENYFVILNLSTSKLLQIFCWEWITMGPCMTGFEMFLWIPWYKIHPNTKLQNDYKHKHCKNSSELESNEIHV